MKWNLTIINATLILYALLLGALFLFTRIHYWEFVDFLVYPQAEAIDFEPGTDQNTDLLISKYLFFSLLDLAKQPVIDFLIATSGYNLLIPINILFGIIACGSLLYLSKNSDNSAAILSAGICFVFLSLAATLDTPVNKNDVDTEFINYNKYEDATGINHLKLLRNKEYTALDKALRNVELKYSSGKITEQEYTFELDKLDSNEVKESDLIYFHRWIKHSSTPEYSLSARGRLYETLGWGARGSKWSKDTSEEQFEKMREYFNKATRDHNEALSINNENLSSYVSLITVAKAGDSGINEIEMYEKANAAFPSSYHLNYRYMTNNEPKWGGSFSKMRTLASEKRNDADMEPKLIALGGYEAAYRGNDYWKDENYDEAIRWYKRALLYAARKSIYRNLNSLYTKQKDYSGAIAILSEALKIYPDDASLLVRRAKNYALSDDLIKANSDAEVASKLSITNAWSLGTIGWVFEKTNNHKKAVTLYKRSLVEDPDYIYVLKRLFYLSHGKNKSIDYEEVLPYIKHWTEIDQENPAAWLALADTLEDLQPQQAIQYYEKYLKLLDPEDSSKNTRKNAKYVKDTLKRIKREQ